MILADDLEKINNLKQAERKELSRLVFKNNQTFARYMDLCYDGIYERRSAFNRMALKYRASEAPMGMHFGTLESVYKKFKQTGYENGTVVPDDKSKARMVQIFEIISETEVVFLKEILKGKYSGLSKAEYIKLVS